MYAGFFALHQQFFWPIAIDLIFFASCGLNPESSKDFALVKITASTSTNTSRILFPAGSNRYTGASIITAPFDPNDAINSGFGTSARAIPILFPAISPRWSAKCSDENFSMTSLSNPPILHLFCCPGSHAYDPHIFSRLGLFKKASRPLVSLWKSGYRYFFLRSYRITL